MQAVIFSIFSPNNRKVFWQNNLYTKIFYIY